MIIEIAQFQFILYILINRKHIFVKLNYNKDENNLNGSILIYKNHTVLNLLSSDVFAFFGLRVAIFFPP